MQNKLFDNLITTVRVTKGGSVLPLYKISVLLKTGGSAGRCRSYVRSMLLLKGHSNDSIDSGVVKGEVFFFFFFFEDSRSNPGMKLFFLNISFISFAFYLICFFFIFELISYSKILSYAFSYSFMHWKCC